MSNFPLYSESVFERIFLAWDVRKALEMVLSYKLAKPPFQGHNGQLWVKCRYFCHIIAGASSAYLTQGGYSYAALPAAAAAAAAMSPAYAAAAGPTTAVSQAADGRIQ